MSALRRQVGAITPFVGDVSRSKECDGQAFGVEPVFEDDDGAALRFTDPDGHVREVASKLPDA